MANLEDVQEVLDIIEEISNDGSVPRNVKKILEDVKEQVTRPESDLKVRVDSAMQLIEELSMNPNLPAHARTQIWNITSVLEDLSKN